MATDTDPHQRQPFTKGDPVEVRSDGEGFRGAWYSATILGIPPKSTSKKRNKALIKYNTLLAGDGSSPLTEHVDPAYIRPLPPNHKGGALQFEVNDVVDACYRYGWWTGVVRKVLEKSKCRVYFDNPPDVIEFDSKDLRVHWNWIGCKWVRPEKQKSTGSIFSSGTAVEVNIDNENLGDIWYPSLVVKENEDNTFLVKYHNSGTVKVVVDSLHIRPFPPPYADRNYELLERVDATYNFGWRSGVIAKVLTGKRYKVFFKNGNEDNEFCHFDIRPNVEWIDGKWVSKSKEVITASDEQEQIGIVLRTQNSKVVAELESSLSTKENTEDKTPLTKMNNNAVEKSTSTDENNASNASKKKVKLETSNGITSRSRPSKKLTEGNAAETPISITCDELKDVPSETLCKEGTPRTGGKGVIGDEHYAKIESPTTGAKTETKEHKVGANDLKRKRGRPRRSVVAATEDSEMADEDQPLSTWIGGMHTSGDEESRLPSARLVNGWNEEKGLVDTPIESLSIDASGRSPLVNDQSLPFVKRSPVWRTIESMDVFQIVPQKPHFLPLAENREEFREGSAIGIMVTFANLFEKMSMLHFDEPRDTFDSILESLSDLEKHGFDVSRLRHCLNKLLSLKEGHNQHLLERQNAEREIIENTQEISKFDEEMEEIEKKISQLQERHASIKSEKETKNLKVGSLELHVSFLNKLIQNASHDFKKIAIASWKLP